MISVSTNENCGCCDNWAAHQRGAKQAEHQTSHRSREFLLDPKTDLAGFLDASGLLLQLLSLQGFANGHVDGIFNARQRNGPEPG